MKMIMYIASASCSSTGLLFDLLSRSLTEIVLTTPVFPVCGTKTPMFDHASDLRELR